MLVAFLSFFLSEHVIHLSIVFFIWSTPFTISNLLRRNRCEKHKSHIIDAKVHWRSSLCYLPFYVNLLYYFHQPSIHKSLQYSIATRNCFPISSINYNSHAPTFIKILLFGRKSFYVFKIKSVLEIINL